MFVRLSKYSSLEYDTSDDEYNKIIMESWSWESNSIIKEHEFRDIKGIHRSFQTSNCHFINTICPKNSVSSKDRFFSSANYITYSDKARKICETIINAHNKKEHKRSMTQVYALFMDCQANNDYITCDDLLASISVEKCSPTILLSLLMASYPIRKRLSKRQQFYLRVYKKFTIIYNASEAFKLLDNLK